ncbi:MAG: 2-phosphosulfolactate phosphatase [Gemmatimonadetes bacterium]|nr:2-phosphosulfolactate phosphatase [Gemmatimonadota bacterium]
MRVDVHFGPTQLAPAEITGRVIAVIDVLRASSSIAAALNNGARAVVPLESSEEVVNRAKAFERSEVKLAGERRMLAIEGFDAGNSPLEFTSELVEGKTVLMTTSNGTTAIMAAAQGARDVVVASYVNFTAVCTMLRAALRGGADIAIVCAGRDKQFSLEDAACAGRFVTHVSKRLAGVEQNDAALAAALLDRKYGENRLRLFQASAHGQALVEAGFAADLQVCGTLDAYPVIPIYQDRQITKLGPDRER